MYEYILYYRVCQNDVILIHLLRTIVRVVERERSVMTIAEKICKTLFISAPNRVSQYHSASPSLTATIVQSNFHLSRRHLGFLCTRGSEEDFRFK